MHVWLLVFSQLRTSILRPSDHSLGRPGEQRWTEDEDEDRVLEPWKDTTHSTSNNGSSDSNGRDSNNSGDDNSGDNNSRDNNSRDDDSGEHGHGNIDEDYTNKSSIDEASSSGKDRDDDDDGNDEENAHIGVDYDNKSEDSIMDLASDFSSDLSNLTVWNIRYVTTIQFQSWNDIPYSLPVHFRFIIAQECFTRFIL